MENKVLVQTTSIPLNERFKILESKDPLQVSGPSRSLKLAMDMATASTRLSAKQRLGPKVNQVRPFLKGFQAKGFQTRKAGFQIKKVLFQPRFKTTYIHKTVNNTTPKHNAFKKNVVQRPNQRPNQTQNKFVGVNRFQWKNPNLVKKNAFTRRPAKAKKEDLDTDLDNYMSKSRGYLTGGIDAFLV